MDDNNCASSTHSLNEEPRTQYLVPIIDIGRWRWYRCRLKFPMSQTRLSLLTYTGDKMKITYELSGLPIKGKKHLNLARNASNAYWKSKTHIIVIFKKWCLRIDTDKNLAKQWTFSCMLLFISELRTTTWIHAPFM